MIGKAKAVAGSAKGISYLQARQDKHPELAKGYELSRNMLTGEKPGEIMRELKGWNDVNPAALKNKVFTLVMSPSITDGEKLTDEELETMGKEFLRKTLDVNPDLQPYYMYVHTEKAHKHVHIYTPRTDSEGQTISDHFIGKKAQAAADKVAAAHHLTRAKNVGQEHRQAIKEELAAVSREAVSFDDYRLLAKKKGIKVVPTINHKGEMQGYRLEKDGHSYKASEIDRKAFLLKTLQPLFQFNATRKEKDAQQKIIANKKDRGFSLEL